MNLAENVRKFRKQAGLSQQALADRVPVRQNTIASIESGATKKTRFLADIARALGVNVSDLDPGDDVSRSLPIPGSELVFERDLPLHGSVEAGEGGIVLSNEPVDRVRRPGPLAN